MPWWNMQYYPNWGKLFFLPFLVPILIWSAIWKGLALYKAARKEQKAWFVILLIVNTMGILEIVYLLFFSDRSNSKKRSKK